jgi:hypothetical protein
MKNSMPFNIRKYFLVLPVMMLLIGAMADKRTLKEIAVQKQAQGKFIAVYLHPPKLVMIGVGDGGTNASNLSNICSMDGKAPLKDHYGPNYHATTIFEETLPDVYSQAAKNFADQLNEGLGTTSFKAVFPGGMPLKTVRVNGQEEKVVNWSKAGYDVMINLIATPVYTTHLSSDGYTTEYELGLMMYVNEVIPGQEALGYIGSGHSLATLRSDPVTHRSCFKSLAELKEKVADPAMFSDTFFAASKADLLKVIDKENRKYDKAVK